MDIYGALTIPLTAPAAGESVDPLLTRMLAFVKAFLVDDANATAAWAAIGAGTPLVLRTFEHDPSKRFFSDKDLPALFAWRAEVADPKAISADYRMTSGVVLLQWVFPPAPQDRQRIRDPFITALSRALDVAFSRGRTPSYIVPGDTEPQAAYLGSWMDEHLGVLVAEMGRARAMPLTIASRDTSAPMKPMVYESVLVEVHVDELFVDDPARFDTIDGGMSGTIYGGSPPQLQTESFIFGLALTGCAPSSGPAAGGTAITISGSGFTDGAVVSLGGALCTNVVVVSPTRITCTTPAHAAGVVSLVVTLINGETKTLDSAFTYS